MIVTITGSIVGTTELERVPRVGERLDLFSRTVEVARVTRIGDRATVEVWDVRRTA